MSDLNITMYGTAWCGDCKRSLRVLKDLQWPYTYVDIEQDDQAAAYVQQVNNGSRSVPTLVFPDGSVMVEPSNAALKAKLESMK